MMSKPYNISELLENNLLTSPIQAHLSLHCAAKTNSLIHTYNKGITRLQGLSDKARTLTRQRLEADPNYTFGRGIGVKLAWEYEKLDLELGGKGSEEWMYSHKEEILTTGKVRGAQGHHAKNVANHPQEQSNPHNIKFYKNGENHRNQGHGGDFRNESNMPMIDRDKMVKNTKNKSIIKNELKGIRDAAIIGFAISATMSYIIELYRNDISYENFKDATRTATINGAKGAFLGIGSYTVYRGVDLAVEFIIKKIAVKAPDNVLKGVKGGVAGGILITGTSLYEYLQLRKEGYNHQDSLIETGKQAAFPTVTLILSLCGPIGFTFGIFLTFGYMGYSFYTDSKLAKDLTRLQLELLYKKTLNKIKPTYFLSIQS